MRKFSLGKIEGRGIGISAKKTQIKTTAKKSFLFFCSSLLIAMGILCPMAINVSADVPVITKVKTMAELIFTLTAGAGTVITQPTIVNPIISEFGAADFQMQNLVDSGAFNLYDKTTGEVLNITAEEAIEHIGDSEWLKENDAEFKMDYDTFSNKVSASNTLAKTGANLIHQAALQTGNPMEWDWGQLISTYLNQGLLTYELLFTDYSNGTTILQDMNDIKDNILSFWSSNIESGSPIGTYINENHMFTSGYFAYYTINSTQKYNFYYPNGLYPCGYYNTNGTFSYGAYNSTDSSLTGKRYTETNGEESSRAFNMNAQPHNYVMVNTESTDKLNDPHLLPNLFQSAQDLLDYYENNGYSPKSPDLINPILGNLSSEDLQNVSPSIEEGQAIIPFDQSAYQDLINDANDNTNNNTPEDNPALVYPFIQEYIVDNNQANPDPDEPSRPVNPSQPSIPNKDPITDEDMETNLSGTTIGLEEVFPFCIPFDIVKLIKGLRAERKAPVIDWTFESDLFGFSYDFHIDLSEFNDVAAILRTMELIVFIIGLAVATRKLIGAGG